MNQGLAFSFLLPVVGPEMLSQFLLSSFVLGEKLSQWVNRCTQKFQLFLFCSRCWITENHSCGKTVLKQPMLKLISCCLLIFLLWFRFSSARLHSAAESRAGIRFVFSSVLTLEGKLILNL